jgi:uncharacterized protein YutE (UPF0331/DUF86 family)
MTVYLTLFVYNDEQSVGTIKRFHYRFVPSKVGSLLAQANWIETTQADSLKRMIGFRNIAAHDYQSLQMPITLNIITQHLDEFLLYSAAIIKKDANISQ